MVKAIRCKGLKCNRLIRSNNKSGFCQGCIGNEKKRENRRKNCFVCEERCCGKMLIEWHKGKIISLCTFHFNWLLDPKFSNPTDARKEINRLRGCH